MTHETRGEQSPDPSAPPLRVEAVVSPVFGAVCRVLGGADGGPCVIVDPGVAVAGGVRAAVAAHGWRPLAVLATHGHVDHTFDAAELADGYGVALRLHRADAYRVEDPFGTIEGPVPGVLSAALRAGGADPAAYRVPRRVEPFGGGPGGGDGAATGPGPADGLGLRAVHAPGHTEGSTLYVGGGLALTGDVLFAGTVGRTDLPGGDADAMRRTLRDVVGRLGDDVVVLPGHGPSTTMARERAANPFLRV
ncbi:MBL fold metallo-hydrolase [Cellulomonas sp. PhB143]|uniref:MBL fold metallo-hydrolase n=1 Tax=Cellulomonas sp. PhB143 TaxID=2485186 RepID=UPI000FB81895|nr:MBL fold metallo-hydrolase [Cellulomonas sp. PhB143]ROS74570.1 glyoxylase-like metal-dependent hydrolase (beta-lactamase superfamily II) [Cellulomonas sp. PhB143]